MTQHGVELSEMADWADLPLDTPFSALHDNGTTGAYMNDFTTMTGCPYGLSFGLDGNLSVAVVRVTREWSNGITACSTASPSGGLHHCYERRAA
jgi:hypothetical protein